MTAIKIQYVHTHARLAAMVANLQEFIDSMPAPNEDDELPSALNWAVLGDYKHLEETMIEASRITDEISK